MGGSGCNDLVLWMDDRGVSELDGDDGVWDRVDHDLECAVGVDVDCGVWGKGERGEDGGKEE